MEKFFKRKAILESSPTNKDDDSASKQRRVEVEIDLPHLPADPGLGPRITDYDPNLQDQIRRVYINERDVGDQAGGDVFVSDGFSNWKKKDRLREHVGGVNSAHNQASRKFQDFKNLKQHSHTTIFKQSDQVRHEYRIRLNASIDCIRFLLKQGLAFRGHDESSTSNNQGNFLVLLEFLAEHNEDIKVVALKNAPQNLKLTSPDIQLQIVNACAKETTDSIIKDIGDAFFAILVDESRDISIKEQMDLALRYVDKRGCIIERVLGIEHVRDTTAETLKTTIENLLLRYGLSISKLRGQGYDGASNMQGSINGLKTLILAENKSAFYVHCFAHPLQLALVAVAKKHTQIDSLFSLVSNVVNVVGVSCKRRDILQDKEHARLVEAVENGELETGQGLNQETSLKRSGETRWDSHYGSLISLIDMFPSVIDVLDIVSEDGSSEQKGEANNLLKCIQSFEFVFSIHLMRTILGITNELSQALQRKYQDIVNAIALVQVCKNQLQTMRDYGWSVLLDKVSIFCQKHEIIVPNMDDLIEVQGKLMRKAYETSNIQHYKFGLFTTVIDYQLQELNNRFSESSSKLLLCVACLSPSNSFFAFNKENLISLTKLYLHEFSSVQVLALEDELDTYIFDLRSSQEFSGLKGICDLAQTMVETGRDRVYPLVYMLVTLALILPVATATVERAFSAMKIVKSRLRNRMGDQWLNDSLVVYIEKDVFKSISNEKIVQRFQEMKSRRVYLKVAGSR